MQKYIIQYENFQKGGKINSDIQLIIDKVIIPSGFTLSDITDYTHEFCKDITKCIISKISIRAKISKSKISTKSIIFKIAHVTPTYDGGLITFYTNKQITEKHKMMFIKNSNFQNSKYNFRPYDISDKNIPDILIISIKSRDNKKFGCFIFPKHILIDKKIITKEFKCGKIAWRVWPSWVISEINKKKNFVNGN